MDTLEQVVKEVIKQPRQAMIVAALLRARLQEEFYLIPKSCVGDLNWNEPLASQQHPKSASTAGLLKVVNGLKSASKIQDSLRSLNSKRQKYDAVDEVQDD